MENVTIFCYIFILKTSFLSAAERRCKGEFQGPERITKDLFRNNNGLTTTAPKNYLDFLKP